jgi:hypothetical protein
METPPLLTFFELRGFGNPGVGIFRYTYHHQDNCPACGKNIAQRNYENAEIEVSGKCHRWPDILRSLDAIILREGVIEVLDKERFTGYKAFPVKISKITDNEELARAPIPQYYVLEVTGQVDVDTIEINDELCPLCFNRIGNMARKPKPLVPKLKTWDGSDFVRMRNIRNTRDFCVRRFVDMASKHHWTNFIFGESLPGVGLWGKAPEGKLSYYDSDWFVKVSEKVKAKYPDLFQETSTS